MRALTDEERIALRTIGPPGEGPVAPSVFVEFERLGWGRWARSWRVWPPWRRYWEVTVEGRRALELDDLARRA